ncbi:MAG: CoB--CoM heterodisulfide reductase iron-sulfur subunit A family protein, partial [Candidatus Aenigmarchaeota archaeon]|nr:CoB--CoM heterodisulfide reductase iron-sulfur subunit A family protein [Candidatus Aenigmarchaeota archaeon]
MTEKIGIYLCECGPNIASKIDLDRLAEDLSKLEDYKDKELIIKKHKLLCSVAGKQFLEDEINENKLTHMVCAACSPRDHDSTFINVCKKTQLNPYLYTIINIREQVAWIIPDMEEATDKALKYVHAGMNRVLYQTPLEEKQLDSNPDVLVIGGGMAGMEAALSVASKERMVFLVEKSDQLGGNSTSLFGLMPVQDENLSSLQRKIADVKKSRYIKVFTNAEVERIVGFMGNFEVLLNAKDNDGILELLTGAVVVATGYNLLDPNKLEYINYTAENNVFNALEIEEMISEKKKVILRSGDKPKSVALVHCVGRDEVGYCSKICCNYNFKISNYMQKQGITKITHLVKDLCAPNKTNQKFHDKVKSNGAEVVYINNFEVDGSKLKYTNRKGEKVDLDTDMIVLAPATIPSKSTEDISKLLNLDLDEAGFFQEAHMKINPISTNIDGVFAVGSAHAPGSIVDALVQAKAAGGKILTQLIPGQKIIPEVKVSEVLEAYCTGCQTCLQVCKYDAIYFDEEKGISVVNEAICRGCGNCIGSCPS